MIANASNWTAGANETTNDKLNTSAFVATPPGSLSVDNVNITEGNSGTKLLTFTVTLSSANVQTVTVDYSTVDGTATTADSDYVAKSGTLTFAPGDLTKTVSVTINGDTNLEANETFKLHLSNPTVATINVADGTGTITNDDITLQGDDHYNVTAGQTLSTSGTPITWDESVASTAGGVVLSNAGTIASTGATAIDAPASAPTSGSSSFALTNTGTVTGATNGIHVASGLNGGTFSVDNSGTINGTATRAIDVINFSGNETISVTNETGGVIHSANDGIRVTGTGTFTGTINIDNSGTIASLGTGQGVDLTDIVATEIGHITVTNHAGATISAADNDGLRPGAYTQIFNSGNIIASNVPGNITADGIDGQSNAGIELYNAKGAVIDGNRHGVTGNDPFYIDNAGQITGHSGSGINQDTQGTTVMTVINETTGVITGNSSNGRDGDGIDIDGQVNITNHGTIQTFGHTDGETNEGLAIGGGTVFNDGTIYSDERGIRSDDSNLGNAFAGTTVINHGTITGHTLEAISITDFQGDSIHNYSDGTINGDIVTGSGDDSVINEGILNGNISTGDGNDAITGGAGNQTIDGGAGNDTASYAGSWVSSTVTATTVSNSTDGTDTLSNVENLSFAGHTVAYADAINQGPTANDDTGTGLAEDTTLSASGNVLANDTDPNLGLGLGETLSVTGARAGTEAAGGTLTSVTGATVIHGTYGDLTVNTDGSYAYALNNNSAAVQKLDKGQHVSDLFTYQASDAHGLTDTAQLSFDVVGTKNPYKLQLLSFSDEEGGQLSTTTAYKLAGLVQGFKAQIANTLTVSGGDTFIPGPFNSAGTDDALKLVIPGAGNAPARPDVAILNAIGIDAAAIGNHEFDLGSTIFNGAIGASNPWVGALYPYLSANLDVSTDLFLAGKYVNTPSTTALETTAQLAGKIAPSAVKNVGGENIGIIGLTPQNLKFLSSPSGATIKGDPNGVIDVNLAAAQVQAAVDELTAKGVNKIVLTTDSNNPDFDKAVAQLVHGVDIVIAGGSHQQFGDANDTPLPGQSFDNTFPVTTTDADGNAVLIVSSAEEYQYLNRLVVGFDSNGHIDLSSLDNTVNGAYASTDSNVAAAWNTTTDNLNATAYAAGTSAAKVKAITDAIHNVIVQKDGNINGTPGSFGYSNVFLEGDRAQVRYQETNLGDLSADANADAARKALGLGTGEALISIKNGGGIRSSIGFVDEAGNKLANIANPDAGKPAGAVSQLDVENALRFNNALMTFTTTAQGLVNILNSGNALVKGQGGFVQIGGVQFSWDPSKPAGSRVQDVSLVDANGNKIADIADNGVVNPNAPALIHGIVLNFTAQGGDGYAFKANADNFQYVKGDGTLSAVVDESLDFTAPATITTYTGSATNLLGEQKVMEDYVASHFDTPAHAFNLADTTEANDLRIQNQLLRTDTVLDGLKPVITSNGGGDTGTTSIDENTAAVTTVTSTHAAADTVTYSITGGADAALFQINAATGALSFKNAPNYEVKADANHDNTYEVTVAATDGTLSDSQALSIAVNDVADTHSSVASYLLPTASGVTITPIITTGDPTSLVGGGTYLFGGTPDGIGMFDNNDGTVTVLVNHEITTPNGTTRADGAANGSWVSQLVIDKATLSVISGQDAWSTLKTWDNNTHTYVTSTSSLSRLCSADLPAVSAYYNAATGLGTQARIFMTGEEPGAEGRQFGAVITGANAGTAYELPWMGKFSHENAVANAYAQDKTIVMGTDDAGGGKGQVYVYIGTKTNTGTDVDKAGLTDGQLYGIKVTGLTQETEATNLQNATFTLAALGDVSGKTGAQLEADSNTAGVTQFLRPEDISWDPTNPARGYFVVTDNVASDGTSTGFHSRLYQFTFTDITDPTKGGTISAVLDGTEGQVMFDNITVDAQGLVTLCEDPGNNVRVGRVWQYDPSTDHLTEIAHLDPAVFLKNADPKQPGYTPDPTKFQTQDEETSGVLDVTSTFGDAHHKAFLIDTQNHALATGPNAATLVEGGQLQMITQYFNNPAVLTGTQAVLAHGTEDTPYTVTKAQLLAGYTDPNGDTLSVGTVTVSHGSVQDNGDGTYTITPDANVNGAQTISYTVTDGQGGSTAATLGLTLDPVNDAPTAVTISNDTIPENSILSSLVGTLGTTDVDNASGFTYQLLDNAGGTFLLNSGKIYVANPAALDYEKVHDFSITVKSTDAGGLSVTQQLTIHLTNVVENQTWTGTAGADTFTAPSDDNWTIDGKGGNDTVTTGAGNDVVYASAGNDTYSTGGGNDKIVFSGTSGGYDSVDGGSGTDTITVSANNTRIGLSSIHNVEAITAGTFTGATIVGTLGNDSLDFTGVTLTGIGSINGNNGNDQIIGSAGADRIIGGAGADTLTGGAGADTFVYTAASQSGLGVKADHILDFTAGVDKIDLSAIDANTKIAGHQTFTFIGTDDFTGLGQVRIGTSGGHVILTANLAGDLAADFSIVLDNNPVLTANDFIF